MTSRIDERVKILLENQEKIYDKFEKIIEKNIEMQTKIMIFENKFEEIDASIEEVNDRAFDLEASLHDLKRFKSGTENQIKNIAVIIYNISIPVLIGYILYILGVKQ
jgi:chromosome segregation ATPase